MVCGALLVAILLLSPPVFAQNRLDTTTFIVVGEGLAAGMADFSLREVYQEKSFPAQMARQMNALMPQPLIESPGIGNVPGFPSLPPRLPGILQGSVRTPFPPYLFVFNLSVPGMRVADSLQVRPAPPLIQQRDAQQTLVNLILGYPALIAGADLPLWTQAEYAAQMRPTFAIVALGYFDVLEPAVNNNPAQLPEVAAFRADYEQLLTKLKQSFPELLVLTIPNPFDTAYFTPMPGTTRLVGAEPEVLSTRYKVDPNDLITPKGLMLLGNFTLGDVVINNPLFPGLGAFFPGTVVSASTQTAVTARVEALNNEIRGAAGKFGARVYDLNALFRRIRDDGLWVGTKHLTADFLGGFYSLNGYYPGTTGHALIANELLAFLNQNYNKNYPALDLAELAREDPAVRFRPEFLRGARSPAPRRLPSRDLP